MAVTASIKQAPRWPYVLDSGRLCIPERRTPYLNFEPRKIDQGWVAASFLLQRIFQAQTKFSRERGLEQSNRPTGAQRCGVLSVRQNWKHQLSTGDCSVVPTIRVPG